MINTKELILGSKLHSKRHKGLIVDVAGIYYNGIVIAGNPLYKYKPEEFNPIEITPDILEKAGFVKHKNSNEYWTFWKLSNGWYISQSHHNEASAGVEKGKFYYGEEYILVPNLHRLQALYLFLTGKPLNIEL